MRTEQKLDFLQALRGIAILLVVLSHARWFFLKTPYQEIAENVLRPGASGVDVFFVISGFIMAYTTRGNDGSVSSVGRFFVRRLTKIWIPYAVIGLLTFALVKTSRTFDPENLIWIFKSLVFIPPDLKSFLYLGGGLTHVAWSLNYEVYFYLIFGLSMLFARFRYLAFFLWMFLFLIAYPLWDHSYVSLLVTTRVDSQSAYLQMMVNPIIFEFLAGILIGQLYCSKFSLPKRLAAFVAVIGIFLFITSLLLPDFDNGLTGWGVGAIALVLSLSIASKSVDLPHYRSLTWIGNISYSLYLVHPLVNILLGWVFYVAGIKVFIPTLGYVALTTAVSIGCAAIAHKALDEYLHVKVRDWLLQSRLLAGQRAAVARASART